MAVMRLGLIGKPLGHSWSKQIHESFLDVEYQMWELGENELDDFFERRDFDGINVTIPYKQRVIAYLDELDDKANKIGAVNCIVNHDGKLKGYNTDYLGFMMILKRNNVDCNKACVLGNGGASKAVCEALDELDIDYDLVSRRGYMSYEELYERESEFDLLINTTPVGMYPEIDEVIVDIDRFSNLKWVVDIVANPLCTRLQYEADKRNINSLGGIEMLVNQAFIADELYTDSKLDESMIDVCLSRLIRQRQNIVLIGMPSSGKSSVGRSLSDRSGRVLYDSDEMIVKDIDMPISSYFELYGEDGFRKIEKEVYRKLSLETSCIISCGGGAILDEDNMRRLKGNGLIVYLRRDLDKLESSTERPLSSNRKDLESLFESRKGLYEKYADVCIDNNDDIDDVVDKIGGLII